MNSSVIINIKNNEPFIMILFLSTNFVFCFQILFKKKFIESNFFKYVERKDLQLDHQPPLILP